MNGSLAARVARVTGVTLAAAMAVTGVVTAVFVYEGERAALDRELSAAVESFGESGGAWEIEHPNGRIRVWEARLDELPADRTAEARDRERPVVFNLGDDRVMLLVSEREDDTTDEPHDGEEANAEDGAQAEAPHPEAHRETTDADDDGDGDRDDGLAHDRKDRDRADWAPLPRWDADRARREGREVHRLVAASAQRVAPWRTVAPFLLAYGAASILVAGLTTLALGRLARLALEPLDAARRAADAAVGAAHGLRLDVEGPEEVRALLTAMNALLARVDSAATAQSRFTAEAAHELRTPITVLLGELEVALRRPRDIASLTDTLRSVQEEAQRLAELVEGLLTLARVDAGQAEQGREPVRAGELAERAAARERRSLDAAGCVLTVDLREDTELEGHAALLTAALSNLLRNASVHAPGAPVRLTIDRGAGRARFVVEDGGPGIPAEERVAVFDRLARSGVARRKSRGLGLGLPLAREIARRHGGDCVIGEAVGGGCRVELWV